MGTHNCLLKLGERVYLEVIAIDPSAPKPPHPRWFRFDSSATNDPPRLCGWVARTNDINSASRAASHLLGNIEPMNRGTLDWLITVPGDGSLPFEGVAPMLIQWESRSHPASRLPDKGCSLVRLEGIHPQASVIQRLLQAIGFQDEFVVSMPLHGEAPHLVAHIQTPRGLCRLDTSGVERG